MTRRELLKMGVATAGAAAIGGPALATQSPPSTGTQPRLRVLVLGGTRFLGPSVVRAAVRAGHHVTMFNRGISNPWLFPGVERRIGNRFPETAPGLDPLRSGRWDIVLDLSAQYPRLVSATAELLKGRVRHYVLVSSIGVYGDYRRGGIDESTPVLRNPPAFGELPDLYETDWHTYGWRKVLCEDAARQAFGNACTIVRPGHLIGQELGGQNRSDGRWYWPARFSRDSVIGVPGDGNEPVQFTDIRDLADFLLKVGSEGLGGTFNIVGNSIPFRDYIATVREAVGRSPEIVWFGRERSRRILNVPYFTPFDALPGFATISNARAVAAGMKFRPLKESVSTDWLFFRENLRADHDFSANGTGLSPALEAELLAERS